MIKILTVPHTLFAARNLVNTLNKLGHQAAIFDKPVPGDESMYIIYQANHVAVMPKNYILQQTEISTSHWFKPESGYLRKIKKARAVWDYSEENIAAYRGLNKNVFILQPGVYPQPTQEKDIEFLFYGWIEGSERRHRIVNSLKSELGDRLLIVTDKLREDMWSILARTKAVLNVHYHENSPLEAYRVAEARSFSCEVWTERRGGPVPHQAIIGGGVEFIPAHADLLSISGLIDGLRLAGIETINEIEV